jgi:hypothetical protein
MEDGMTHDPNGGSAEMLEHAIFELQALDTKSLLE